MAQGQTDEFSTPEIRPEHAVEFWGLSRTFVMGRGRTVQALDDINYAIGHGQCLAVVGESGSGKTTLARIVVGLERPDAGTVVLNGHEVRFGASRKNRRTRSRLVQMVFQDPQGSFNRRLPAGAAVDEVLRAHFPEMGRRARRSQMLRLFADVGLEEQHADALPAALSGGQKQRVAIARALAAEPTIMVLDEAVSALDVSVQAQVLQLLKRLRHERGLTYVFITHDLSVVREVADAVLVMRYGRVVEAGPVSQVLDSPEHPYTRLLIDSAPRPGWKPQRNLRSRLLGAET
ncbi:ABC transporter ATP-binding protein [Nesterenkonia natronophila]|uniref:ABC transporter ATP-binding protein n=1 Tax=Nesterenkonia natronophila TaxID=2174932 RepID=A0A3A4F266_9MICC|nr:ATP-binding cassette domain-containing protein [Nesterenkonia natronophila]RJN32382.1 ABC transporter ATP-binding protein [Nesterenkonia natronophila]